MLQCFPFYRSFPQQQFQNLDLALGDDPFLFALQSGEQIVHDVEEEGFGNLRADFVRQSPALDRNAFQTKDEKRGEVVLLLTHFREGGTVGIFLVIVVI